jgi:hypothetical protein
LDAGLLVTVRRLFTRATWSQMTRLKSPLARPGVVARYGKSVTALPAV